MNALSEVNRTSGRRQQVILLRKQSSLWHSINKPILALLWQNQGYNTRGENMRGRMSMLERPRSECSGGYSKIYPLITLRKEVILNINSLGESAWRRASRSIRHKRRPTGCPTNPKVKRRVNGPSNKSDGQELASQREWRAKGNGTHHSSDIFVVL